MYVEKMRKKDPELEMAKIDCNFLYFLFGWVRKSAALGVVGDLGSI